MTQHTVVALLATVIVSAVLSACTSPSKKLTQADFDAANQYCQHQVKTDKAAQHPQWFTRWLQCNTTYIMPLEKKIYPHKQHEIQAMYNHLLRMGMAVDNGRSRVQPVYDEWDRMQRAIGMYRGACVKNRDGSQQCMPAGESILFVKTEKGGIVSVKELISSE
jgi:hypothetical protein